MMKKQAGLSLISTLIVGVILMGLLMLGLKLVPVFTEYFAIKKAFGNVASSTDVSASPSEYRNAFAKYAQIDDITSVDPKAIQVSKENGKAILQVSYRREVHLFANAGLVLDFDVSSGR